MASEKLLERKLREGVKIRGGKAYKFVSPGNRGVPDRIIQTKDGRTLYVEIKTTGKKLTPLQEANKADMASRNIAVHVIDSEEDLIEIFKLL